MDIVKIGKFLKGLRNEKGLTQEDLAEKLYVSSRTISRWESGNNMPDIETLLYLSEFYDLELIEILNAERKGEDMNEEVRDTSLKVSEYEKESNKRSMKFIRILLIIAFVGMTLRHIPDEWVKSEVFSNFADFASGFFEGITIGILFFGILYTSSIFDKIGPMRGKFLKEDLKARK